MRGPREQPWSSKHTLTCTNTYTQIVCTHTHRAVHTRTAVTGTPTSSPAPAQGIGRGQSHGVSAAGPGVNTTMVPTSHSKLQVRCSVLLCCGPVTAVLLLLTLCHLSSHNLMHTCSHSRMQLQVTLWHLDSHIPAPFAKNALLPTLPCFNRRSHCATSLHTSPHTQWVPSWTWCSASAR